jgi:hypothetical protein
LAANLSLPLIAARLLPPPDRRFARRGRKSRGIGGEDAPFETRGHRHFPPGVGPNRRGFSATTSGRTMPGSRSRIRRCVSRREWGSLCESVLDPLDLPVLELDDGPSAQEAHDRDEPVASTPTEHRADQALEGTGLDADPALRRMGRLGQDLQA